MFSREDYYETSARVFRQMIHRTVFSIDTQSGRYALGGVLLEAEDSTLVMVGTDGRRLAKVAGPASMFGQPQWDETIIIPGRTVNLLERALAEDDTEIKIAAQANEILVKSPRATIYSRLLEGRYPRWRDVFPERSGVISLELPVGPLLSAVRQAAIVTNEDSRGIDFRFGNGKLVLAGRTAEVGQARIELPVAYQGEEIAIMLDPRFLIDFLKVVSSEETFQLEIQNAESAAVCKAQGDYEYVIMPLSRGQKQS